MLTSQHIKSIYRMFYKLYLITVAFFLFQACNSATEKRDPALYAELDEILINFHHAEAQKTNDRMIAGTAEIGEFINLSKEADIFLPSSIAYSGDTVLFYDYGKNVLTSVDTSLENITTLEARGRGPGEFISASDINLFDNNLYIADGRTGKISVYNTDLNFINDIQLDIRAHRLAISDDGFIAMNSAFDGNGLFVITDKSGNTKGKFESGHINPAAGFYVQGTIKKVDAFLYYASLGMGLLKKYDARGNLIWSRETIKDYVITPMHVSSEGDGMSSVGMHPDRVYKVISMFVFDDFIYALHAGKQARSSPFIDIYETESGDYVETWKSEIPLFSMAVNQHGKIAAIYYDENEEFRLGQLKLNINSR